MKTNQVLASIMAMNVSEIDAVIEAVKFRQNQLRTMSRGQFSVGDKVKFQSTKLNRTVEGIVEKINRKYIIVNANNAGRWNVTPVSLSHA